MGNLTFAEFSAMNRERCHQWMGSGDTLHHHVIGLAGEVGELCNEVKKVDRAARGVPGGKSDGDVAGEIADVLIYLDLVAMHLDVDLEAAVVKKFNATSVKHGFLQQIPIAD